MTNNWNDPNFRSSMKLAASNNMKSNWSDPEFLSRHKKRASKVTTDRNKKIHHCKHCSTSGKGPSFLRYHGDNCLKNPNISNSNKSKRKHATTTYPHYGKSGGGGNMTRYHFDNCKKKVN